MLSFLEKLFEKTHKSYGSGMQEWIESKRPQSIPDIERLQKEYQQNLQNQWRVEWHFLPRLGIFFAHGQNQLENSEQKTAHTGITK